MGKTVSPRNLQASNGFQTTFRLQGCQPDVEVWQRILQVRTLVLGPEDDPVMWIKFANLCRKSERMVLAEKTINSLLTPEKVHLILDREIDVAHVYDHPRHLLRSSTRR